MMEDKEFKVVITCDELVERTHLTEVIESFCELYPHAKLYTLSHKVRGIHGPLELRSVQSSFLSSRVKKRVDLVKWSFAVPAAAQSLFIPCSVDLIINITSGFSHGFKKCANTKMITYFYNDEFISNRSGFIIERFFNKFIRSWSLKKLAQADKVYFSQKSLEQKYSKYCNNSTVLNPAFKLDDFKLFPKNMFVHDYVLINSTGLSEKLAIQLMSLMIDLKVKYRFVGEDFKLDNLKKSHPDDFLGTKCTGEMAPLFAGARFLIDFTEDDFPISSISCLATGRPVLTSSLSKSKEMLKGEGVLFVNQFDRVELEVALKKLNDNYENISGEKLRAPTLKFNEIRFKSLIKKEVEGFFST